MQQFVDKLIAKDPELARFLVNDPNGIDTLLLQFPVFTSDPAGMRMLHDDSALAATSVALVGVAVTDQITGGQTESISATIAVAMGILAIFFWVTLRQPALAVVAVGPILFALICALGTMSLLGIPYTMVTSIITALSIGIGVDYTIHVIHRYREEYSRARSPEQAAIQTLRTTGSALTTAFGFGVLIAAPMLASQQFGVTATITIVSILVALPAMMVWGAYQNSRLRSMVERMWEDLDVAIEDVDRRHRGGAPSS